jgi:ferritin-like metal-binding protein YciE
MELETLRDLYVAQLKDLYSAENQILKALPTMTKKAAHPDLKRAFTLHERQTREQVARLERIFKDLEKSPKGKKCVGMEGLIAEAKELIGERPEPDVLDAGLIAAAQHVEHYEMAGYGCVRTYARLLGEERHAQLLQQTLDEEQETDRLLTELAESSINLEAAD